jgi:signal peptidase I
MGDQIAGRRNGAGLFFAGLILGAPSIMLWMGKWKLAIAYVLASAFAVSVPIILAQTGIVGPFSFPGFDGVMTLRISAFLISIIGLFHAYRLNASPQPRSVYSRWYIALPAPAALLVAFAFLVRTFLFQPFNIPSESSIPNQMVGDYVFVSKFAYKYGGNPRAGDIAVFKYPADPRIDYIKRVVGLPGDKIQMINGVLNINGAPVKMEEVHLPPLVTSEGLLAYHGIRKFYRETLPNGRSYVIADMGETQQDNTEVYVVPKGRYFTMGDNRDNTQDSRFLDKVGYVPRENFVGPVVSLFWNSNGLALSGRPEEVYPKN